MKLTFYWLNTWLSFAIVHHNFMTGVNVGDKYSVKEAITMKTNQGLEIAKVRWNQKEEKFREKILNKRYNSKRDHLT